jgi:hypothetical protein
MLSPAVLRHMALVRTDVFWRNAALPLSGGARISELGTMLAVSRLLVIANIVPSSLILVTLMM